MEITTLKNNSTTMGIQILKQGDFTLTHLVYCDVYFLFYKDRAIWDCEFNELFGDELRDYVFEREPNPNKAAEFIVELYNWGISQQGAFEKLFASVYGEYKQSKDIK